MNTGRQPSFSSYYTAYREDYSSLLGSLQGIKNRGGAVEISSWKLNLALQAAGSKSWKSRLVCYLIGFKFPYLTMLVWKTLDNTQICPEERTRLAEKFKHLLEAKQRRVTHKLQGKAKDHRLKAKAALYQDSLNKISAFQGRRIAPLTSSDILTPPSFLTKVARLLRILKEEDKIKLLEYRIQNNQGYLPSHLEAQVPALNQGEFKNCFFIKADKSFSLSELVTFYEQPLKEEGKTLVIYHEGRNPNLSILTPTLKDFPLYQRRSFNFVFSSFSSNLQKLSELIKCERKDVLSEMFPLIYDGSLISILKLSFPINYNQTLKDLVLFCQEKQRLLLNTLSREEEALFRTAEQMQLCISKTTTPGIYQVFDNQENKTYHLNELKSLIHTYQIAHFLLETENGRTQIHLNLLPNYYHFPRSIDQVKDIFNFSQFLAYLPPRSSSKVEFSHVKPNDIKFNFSFNGSFLYVNYTDSFTQKLVKEKINLTGEAPLDKLKALIERIEITKKISEFAKQNKLVDLSNGRTLKSGEWGIKQEENKYFLVKLLPSTLGQIPLATEIIEQDLETSKHKWKEDALFLAANQTSNKALKRVAANAVLQVPEITPADREKSSLDRLLSFFDEINFQSPAGPYYHDPAFLKNDGRSTTPEKLREGLKTLIDRIKKRERALGVPKDEIEKERFYQKLEKLMRHLVLHFDSKLASAEDKGQALEEIYSYLLNLAEGSLHCGARWQGEAIQIYKTLTGQWNISLEGFNLEESMHQLIDQFKLRIVEEMTNASSKKSGCDPSHGYLFILRSLGLMGYGLPGFEEANYQDMFENLGRGIYENKQAVERDFLKRASSLALTDYLREIFNYRLQDPKQRDFVLAIFRSTALADASLRNQIDQLEVKKQNEIAALKNQKAQQTALTEGEKEALLRLTTPGILDQETRLYVQNLINQKPDHVLAFEYKKDDEIFDLQHVLKRKNFFVRSFDEQIESKAKKIEREIDSHIENWQKENQWISTSVDDELCLERVEITKKGTAALLRHFGFLSKNHDLLKYLQLPNFKGILTDEEARHLFNQNASVPIIWINDQTGMLQTFSGTKREPEVILE